MSKPSGFLAELNKVTKHEHAAALVPASFLLLAVADAIPVPTDAGYFYVQRWLDDHRDELSDRSFWTYQFLNYFSWDVAWYLSAAAVTFFVGDTFTQKVSIGLGIVTVGAIVAVVMRSHGTRAEALRAPNPALALPSATKRRSRRDIRSRMY